MRKKKKEEVKGATFRDHVCLMIKFFTASCQMVHEDMFEDDINRCCFADRTIGLVSGERVALSVLIRYEAKLCKTNTALQAGVV